MVSDMLEIRNVVCICKEIGNAEQRYVTKIDSRSRIVTLCFFDRRPLYCLLELSSLLADKVLSSRVSVLTKAFCTKDCQSLSPGRKYLGSGHESLYDVYLCLASISQ